MEERDFIVNGQAVDRLTATKAVASEFIERRVGDRLGLILFGTNAYLQVPLTFE
jgi:Ca-activated chloride channel family protein